MSRDIEGGGEGTRTLGLYIANVALYQLSYTPEVSIETNGFGRLVGQPTRAVLWVPRGPARDRRSQRLHP